MTNGCSESSKWGNSYSCLYGIYDDRDLTTYWSSAKNEVDNQWIELSLFDASLIKQIGFLRHVDKPISGFSVEVGGQVIATFDNVQDGPTEWKYFDILPIWATKKVKISVIPNIDSGLTWVGGTWSLIGTYGCFWSRP